MTTGATGQLGLALPVQGELSGTWGDTVNNGITQYTNIAIAATLTLTNDGAVTLANTTGDASASNITSTLTGAGTVTAQFAIVRVTGTLTTAKVVTAPSYSKTYTVVNAATGGIVTFKASGQTGVSIAVGESAFVYYNGTDYVKVSSTVATGVTSFQTSLSGLTPSTSTTGAVTLAGTLGTANGGTNLTSFTSGGVVYASSTSALATGSGLTFDGTNFSTTGTAKSNANLFNYNTSYWNVDGHLSNYSATNGVYLNGNIAGWLTLNADGTQTNKIQLYGASSGTGNLITFTTNNSERMRLDSSGNLGIGTSSPSYKLSVSGTSNTVGLGIVGTVASGDSGVFFAPTSAITGSYNILNGSPSATTGVNAYVANANNANATANSRLDVQVGGASAGDPKTTYTISGVLNWCIGVDNSDSDKFKISYSDSPGTNDIIVIDSAGTFSIKNDYQEQTYTANSSTAITLNITTNGTDQVITLTGTATITMPTATAGKSFLLKLKTGAGGYTVTWTTVKWPGGTAPTLTSTASRMDIFSFFSDGTNWYGTTVGQNYTP